jgi:hypothetical protein
LLQVIGIRGQDERLDHARLPRIAEKTKLVPPASSVMTARGSF